MPNGAGRCAASPRQTGSRKIEPINTIGWTVGHLAWQEQLYFLTRAQGKTPVPLLNEVAASGGPPSTPSLKQMMAAWKKVTGEVDAWLEPLTTADLLADLRLRRAANAPWAMPSGA